MKLKASIGHTALSTIPVQRICLCDLSRSFVMKEIQLTQGQFALVDNEDFEYLSQWKWYANKNRNTYYAKRNVCHFYKENGKRYPKVELMHRVLMKSNKGSIIDHINHNGLDNRKENLRIVTNRENCQNRINSAEFTGVYKFNKKLKKPFAASIYINGKVKTLGYFSTAEEAHIVYMNESNNQIIK